MDILTKADWKCRKYAQPWLLELHHAYMIHRYWALTISTIIHTKYKYKPILTKLQELIGLKDLQLQPTKTPSIKL